jgi:PAS domain S-box-containing protein
MNSSASVSRSQDLGEQFRAIAELSGDLAWVLDSASGLPLYLSPGIEDLLSYSADEIGRQLAEPDPHSALAGLCAGLGERLARYAAGDATRRRVLREFSLRRKDGSMVPVEVVSLLVPATGSAPATVAGVIRDVSVRRARDDEQRKFASMLNHEFRTPLSTIDGAIQRLEAKSSRADEATRRRYRNIGEAVDRLIGMLDKYLSPDRLDAIGRSKPPDGIAPRQLLDECAALVHAAGRLASIEAGQLPARLRCAPDGLRLALKVLIDNAVQYSPPDTVIALVGKQVDDGIELMVRDSGGGVPFDETEKIFGKFYRGSNAGDLPGSGLGLYMARSVIDVHGGTVSVRNLENCGVEFKIWLPARDGAGKRVASDGFPIDNSANHHTKIGAGPGTSGLEG